MMNLRKKQYEKGFYLLLNKGYLATKFHIPQERKKTTRKINKGKNSELIKEMDSLNCKILTKLISSTKKSPLVKGEIELSNAISNYLRFSYNLTGRFKDGDELLKDFCFETERYFNGFDYCTIKQKSFKLRLSNPRKLTYLNKDLIEKKKFYKHRLHFKFTVIDNKLKKH